MVHFYGAPGDSPGYVLRPNVERWLAWYAGRVTGDVLSADEVRALAAFLEIDEAPAKITTTGRDGLARHDDPILRAWAARLDVRGELLELRAAARAWLLAAKGAPDADERVSVERETPWKRSARIKVRPRRRWIIGPPALPSTPAYVRQAARDARAFVLAVVHVREALRSGDGTVSPDAETKEQRGYDLGRKRKRQAELRAAAKALGGAIGAQYATKWTGTTSDDLAPVQPDALLADDVRLLDEGKLPVGALERLYGAAVGALRDLAQARGIFPAEPAGGADRALLLKALDEVEREIAGRALGAKGLPLRRALRVLELVAGLPAGTASKLARAE